MCWVGSVLCRSCATYPNGGLGSADDLSYLSDLSDRSDLSHLFDLSNVSYLSDLSEYGSDGVLGQACSYTDRETEAYKNILWEKREIYLVPIDWLIDINDWGGTFRLDEFNAIQSIDVRRCR